MRKDGDGLLKRGSTAYSSSNDSMRGAIYTTRFRFNENCDVGAGAENKEVEGDWRIPGGFVSRFWLWKFNWLGALGVDTDCSGG